MKKIVYLLAFVALAGAACKTKKSATKQKTLHETTVADFGTIIGLSKGDSYEKAVKILGTPSTTTEKENDSYSFYSVYYNDASDNRMFSYTYDKKTKMVNHFRITGNRNTNHIETKNYLAGQKVNDVKVNFLGMHKDSILKVFGTPDRISSDNYEFVKGPVSVTFICYSFHQYKCSEIYVFWNYFWKEPETPAGK
ncbi:MAG TPA: hypothetical protein VEC12_11695 [Bacteroidia bacterium]|nr:hypothetical protein [Bacteroidia bacterium]